MATQTEQLERTIYDFDEFDAQSDHPVEVIRKAIGSVVKIMIEDSDRFRDVYLGIGEIVKDVEEHGDKSSPRLAIVYQELGGLAIDIIDKPKTTPSVHNGLGKIILERVFGDDYSANTDGPIFTSHLFVRSDVEAQQQHATNHAA